jgi:hypothetical protein
MRSNSLFKVEFAYRKAKLGSYYALTYVGGLI